MNPARDGLVDALDGVGFDTPRAPIVSNHDGKAYDDGDGWRARLPEHVTMPVRWRSSMETLVALGADAFVEVGHGSMIAGVAKRTVPGTPVFACGTPEECTNLALGATS
jgi:[acyl-carrier-protein] S-malonyltransferase